MNRWTTHVVAALLFVAAPLAGPAIAQRPAERPGEPGRGPRPERAQQERPQQERAGERTQRPDDELAELRREVQRLRVKLESLQNERGARQRGPAGPGPDAKGHARQDRERIGRGPATPRSGAVRDRLQALRARADRNHDGRLDQAEREAARDVMQRRLGAWRELRGVGPRPDAPRGRSFDARRHFAEQGPPRR